MSYKLEKEKIILKQIVNCNCWWLYLHIKDDKK